MFSDPEQDVKWTCLDCGHVWYDEYIVVYTNCEKEDCASKNIQND